MEESQEELKTEVKLIDFFAYSHLPESEQKCGQLFYETANYVDRSLPENAEKTRTLLMLLEAKGCALRTIRFGG